MTAPAGATELDPRSRFGLAAACAVAPMLVLVLLPARRVEAATSLQGWLTFVTLVGCVISEWSAVYWFAQIARRGRGTVRVVAALLLILALPVALLLFFLVPLAFGSLLYPGARLFGGS